MEDWELVLKEIYRNEPELVESKQAELNSKKIADQLGINDKDLALKLSFLKDEGFINHKNNKISLTKKGTHYYTFKKLFKDMKKGMFIFTSSLLLAVVFNFLNWTGLFNSWILLEIYLSVVSIIAISSFLFWK